MVDISARLGLSAAANAASQSSPAPFETWFASARGDETIGDWNSIRAPERPSQTCSSESGRVLAESRCGQMPVSVPRRAHEQEILKTGSDNVNLLTGEPALVVGGDGADAVAKVAIGLGRPLARSIE